MHSYKAARVDDQNVIVNIEEVTDHYVEAMTERTGHRWIAYTDDQTPHVGLTYDAHSGTFEEPPLEEPLVAMDAEPLPEAFTQ